MPDFTTSVQHVPSRQLPSLFFWGPASWWVCLPFSNSKFPTVVIYLLSVRLGAEQHSVDSLAFDTLVPKSILQRYVSLLLDHRRIILCGSSGTGKTYMARRFAEHLIIRCELMTYFCIDFDVDHMTDL